MRKIFFYFAPLIIMAMAMASCQKDDTDFSDIIPQYQVEPASIELDFSALSEAPDVPVTDETDSAYNDYVENSSWSRVIHIAFDGSAATVTGTFSGVAVQTVGAHVTVTNLLGPVKFVVSGKTPDGSIKFYGDKRFQICLDGADITNPHGAAINNQGGKSLYVVLADGTTSTLRDGATYTDVGDEDQKAALFSEGQIIFSGKGRLDVYATGRGGIRSDDYIRIRPGANLYVNSSALDGLRANDGIILDGGVINIESSGNGAKAVRAEGPMTVNGGRLVAISTGAPRYSTTDAGLADTTACAAMHCDSMLVVNSGDIRLKATGDGGKGLNAQHHVAFIGGSLQAVADGTRTVKKPKGVKVDGNFTISGGYFYTYSHRSDPLEVAGTLSVASGYKTYDRGPKLLIIAY